jgi:predicted nucleic acid-binding protein
MICVDASLATKWLFDEEYREQALALAAAAGRAGEQLVGPPLLPIEMTNIIRQRMRRRGLALAEAHEALALFFRYPVAIVSLPRLAQDALTLAATHDLPATYDAHYLALAQHLDCELWTGDQRLLNQLAGRLRFIRWIGAYDEEAP